MIVCVFIAILGATANCVLFVDNIQNERYAITPINLIGFIFCVASIFVMLGG